MARRTAATVTQAVEEFLAAFPQKVHTILTDNDGAFTDRFAVHKQGKPAGQPSGTHRLDHVCRAHGITHRLIRPYHPQTNMVERFNRRLWRYRVSPRFGPIAASGVTPSGTPFTRVVDNSSDPVKVPQLSGPLALVTVTGHNRGEGR